MNKQTTSNMGRDAADFVNDAGASAADAIENVTDRASQAVSSVSGGVANVASKAKAQFDSAADYVREFDFNAMIEDAKQYAKANPVPVLLGALAIGFLAGRSMRHD